LRSPPKSDWSLGSTPPLQRFSSNPFITLWLI